MARPAGQRLTHVIFDVDGVFTTGQFIYTAQGKFAKTFGPHDADGIKLLKPYVTIEAVSADKRGFGITTKRIQDDMGIPLNLVAEAERLAFFMSRYPPDTCVYMGDGMHDVQIFNLVRYSIAPANAFPSARAAADFVTSLRGGEGAVGEACLHILEKFQLVQQEAYEHPAFAA